ncbi:MAG TPA: endonuclease Q family protein [Candidatus Binatia bacterium]|nr:endonuclease Q family protein [Candidatus Binatia bacterium]
MGFFADFHIHSRYSRGTSKTLDLQQLAAWAAIKGIQVLGSGDFTHPLWLESIKNELRESAGGLYSLRTGHPGIFFILSSEISLIYKQNGKVRKVHLLVLAPSLAAVEKINSRLGQRFNLKADGRPILGMSARDLTAEILDIDDGALIIPAHIWTPWFSLLGSKSGFDSVDECFEDYAPHIHAVETGLSADPPMLAAVSSLRRLTFLSNSDAHSAANLGREANELDCELSYAGIARAIRCGRIVRTIEFFPEAGKYHYDGHRHCSVSLSPAETDSLSDRCPVCAKPLTLGVLHRVRELSDREGKAPVPFIYQIPLKQILAQVLQCGQAAKKVDRSYRSLLDRFGSEFHILQQVPINELSRNDEPVAACIQAMRENRVRRVPGYDGVYGRVFLEPGRGGSDAAK